MITKILDIYNINEEQFLELFDEIDSKHKDIYDENRNDLISSLGIYNDYKKELVGVEYQLKVYEDDLKLSTQLHPELTEINNNLMRIERDILEVDEIEKSIDIYKELVVATENYLGQIIKDIIYMNEGAIS